MADSPPITERIRVHAVVHGTVQGVSFRAALQRRAQETGVCGWVSNTSEGSVEAVLEGPSTRVASVVDWLHHGPDNASVERVHVVQETPDGLTGFEVR